MRLLLALWLAVFSLQSADVFAVVVPDDCVDIGQTDGNDDSCPDQGCARCLCCARHVGRLAPSVALATDAAAQASPSALVPPSTSASPRRILHVPKTSYAG